jgi:hypothetical protein
MKKITLALALLASVALNVQAQKLGFVNKDEVVADGSTVVCESAKNIFTEILSCETGSLALKNYTSDNIQCSVSIKLKDNTLGTVPEICMGGNCRLINSWPYTFDLSMTDGKSELLRYDISPKSYGSMLSEFTVVGGGETHTINIKFVHADPAGIDDVAADGKFIVFNTQGNIVARGISASDVEDLQPGLYIVRGDNSRQARKVLVRN